MNLKIVNLNSMYHLYSDITDFLKEQWKTLTFKHVLYLIIISIIFSYITNYLLKFKLLKWIYVGTFIILIFNLYNQGDDKTAIVDIYKLSLL